MVHWAPSYDLKARPFNAVYTTPDHKWSKVTNNMVHRWIFMKEECKQQHTTHRFIMSPSLWCLV